MTGIAEAVPVIDYSSFSIKTIILMEKSMIFLRLSTGTAILVE